MDGWFPLPCTDDFDRAALAPWAAGFFEGEGSIGCYRKLKGKPGFRTQITFSQVSREPLDKFVYAVGSGKVYGPYDRLTKFESQAYYTLYITDTGRCWGVIQLIRKWLSKDRNEQIDKAFRVALATGAD